MAKSKELIKRVLVAVIAIPLLIYLFYLGGLFFGALVALVSLAGYYEFLSKAMPAGFGTVKAFAIIMALVYQASQLMMLHNGSFNFFNNMALATALVIIFIICLPVFLFRNERRENLLKHLSMIISGFFYTQVLLSFLILIRESGDSGTGFYAILFMFSMIWINDTGAYFGGKLFGKNKLAPKLSPNKTIEGFLISVMLTMVCSVIFHLIFKFPGSFIQALILGLLLSVMAMYGDLIESGFKRSIGIKDFGSILPGHGGVLDRFDSAIIAGPAVFGYFLVIGMPGISVIQ